MTGITELIFLVMLLVISFDLFDTEVSNSEIVQCKRVHCPILARKSHHFVSTMNNMCYMFVGQEMFWDEARNYCWNLGGELISIENQDIMDHVKKMLDSRRVRWSKRGIWIGAKYFGKKRGWRWTTDRVVKYGYWAEGQPSLFLGRSFEDCALMRREDGWRWHDYYCHFLKYHYNFICQFHEETVAVDMLYTSDSQAFDESSSQAVNHEAHAASNSVDNGNTLILGIITGTTSLLILIVIVVFVVYRYTQKKKYSRNVPATLYGNESYSGVNLSSESPAIFHNRPRTASDVYLTPAEVNTLYEEVNKPANHGNNHLNHITCPLLANESINTQNHENELQAAEGSSIEPVTSVDGAEGGSMGSEPSELPHLPGISGIPAIMETSTRSVNEYVDMVSGAAILNPSTNTNKETKAIDVSSYCKPKNNGDIPVYGNVPALQSQRINNDNNIYEELP